MNTTAIYENRVNDKLRLEIDLGLEEFGDDAVKFFLPDKTIFAIGYVRIVYGDHGPYIEFTKNQIKAKLFSKYNNNVDIIPQNPRYYYYWLYPENNNDVKVYLQLKTVHDLPNAPKRRDGRKSNFDRIEGYADYKVGYYYVDPYELKLSIE